MQIKNWSIIGIVLFALFTINHMNNFKQDKISIILVMPPRSTDPMDFDYSIHHNTMRSVLASLVSNYKKGHITPQIAESWKVNENKTEWNLKIDKSWTFANGDPVTPEIIARNFKRLILLKNKNNSKSGLLEFLTGSQKLKSINEDFEGISIHKNELNFRFIKPTPDFLEKISFGLYSIAHPSDYDENGLWKDKKRAIASGLYEISTWNSEKLILEIRKDLITDTKYKNNFKTVEFRFPEDLSQVGNAEIIFSDRISPKLNQDEWEFASSALNNKIIYVQVMKWNDEKSFFSNRENRRKLRSIFYKNLVKSGMTPVKSFFPLTIPGVESLDFDPNVNVNVNLNGESISTQPFLTTNYQLDHHKKSQGDIFSEAFVSFTKEVNSVPQIKPYPDNPSDEAKVFDIQFLGTGISIDSPKEDIRFMFNSKQGIMLPDESGIIHQKIQKDFSIQAINQEMWNQAIIWPIKHYSSGFWYKKNSNLNLEDLNLLLTPIDLQFLKSE